MQYMQIYIMFLDLTLLKLFVIGYLEGNGILQKDGILHIQLPAPQQQKALPVNPNLIEIE